MFTRFLYILSYKRNSSDYFHKNINNYFRIKTKMCTYVVVPNHDIIEYIGFNVFSIK